MIGKRSIISLSQFFVLQQRDWVELLFNKHAVETPHYTDGWNRNDFSYLKSVQSWLNDARPEAVEAIVAEVVRTPASFRNRVSPRYEYDERYRDLAVCLALDGYLIQGDELLRVEPSLDGQGVVEDDLTRELQQSGLPVAENVLQLLNNSAEDFRRVPADLNGALTNSRVALQTLGTGISAQSAGTRPAGFDETKWGQVVTHLRTSAVITAEEEKGLAGVFGFVSPGAHTIVGLSETEMVRLGRSLVVSMCYFLVKRWNGRAR